MRHVKSSPMAHSTLTSSPDAIRRWLSEPTEPTELPGAKISLATDASVAIATAPLTRAVAADAPVVATITRPLAAEACKVTWKAMSKDGHVINNTFGFKVSGK